MALGSGLFSAGVASAGGAGTRIGAAFVEIFADTTGLKKGFAETETLMTSFAARMQGASAVAGRAGSFITRNLSLPLAALGGVSVKMAADFDQAMTRTVALAGARAVGTMDELRTSVLKLAGDTAQAPKDVADSLFFVASAGLKTADVMPVVEASAQAAAAQLGDAATIGQLLTSVLVAYGKDAPTAASAMDTLTESIRLGKAEPEDLAKSLGTVIPVAALMGVSFDQVAAAIAASTNQGIEASRAATGLRYMLIQLANPSEQAKKILLQYGTSIEEVQKGIEEDGLVNALSDLSKEFNLNSAAGKEAFFTAVGGVRAGQIALALVGKNMKAAQEITAGVGKAAGDTANEFQDAFRKMTSTPAFKFQKAWNDLKIAAIDAGTALMPIATEIVGVVSDLAHWFTNLSDASQGALLNIGKWIVIGGPLLKLFAGLVGWVTKAYSAFKLLSGVSAATSLAQVGAAGQIPGQLALPGLGAEAAGAGGAAARIGAIGLSLGEFAGYAAAAVLAAGYISSAFEDASTSADDLAKETNFTTENINLLKDNVENSAAGLNVFGSKTDKVREAGTLAAGVVKDLTEAGYSLQDAWAMVNGEFENSIDIVGGLSGSIPEFVRGIRARLGVLTPEQGGQLLGERFAAGARYHPPPLPPLGLTGRGVGPGVPGAPTGLARMQGAIIPPPDTEAWNKARQQIVAALVSVKESGLDVDEVFGVQMRQMLDDNIFTWGQLTSIFEDAGLAMPYQQAGQFAEGIFRLDNATVKVRKDLADTLGVFNKYNLGISRGSKIQIESALASGDAGEARREANTALRNELPALLDHVEGLNKQKQALAFSAIAQGKYADAWDLVTRAERRERQERRRAQREGIGPEGDPTAGAGAAIRAQRQEVETLLATEPDLKGWGKTLQTAAEFDPADYETAKAMIDAIGVSFDDLNAKSRRRIQLAVRSGNSQRILNAISHALQWISGRRHHGDVDLGGNAEDKANDIYDKVHALEAKQWTMHVDAETASATNAIIAARVLAERPVTMPVFADLRGTGGGPSTGPHGLGTNPTGGGPGPLYPQKGGWIGGSGSGDHIPAFLEPGEFVVRRDVARRYGGFLEAMNGPGDMAFHRPAGRRRGSSPVMTMSRHSPGAGGGDRNLTVNVQGRMEYSPRDLRRNLEGWWRRRDW